MYRPAPRPLMLVFPTRASSLIASISETEESAATAAMGLNAQL